MRYGVLLAAALALGACSQASAPAPEASASAATEGTMETTNATVEPVPAASASSTETATGRPMSETPSPSPAVSPSPCGADKAARFVGKIATPDVRAQTIEAVGHNRIRWIGPDTVVTMDFSESRLNMSLDADNRITGAKCG